MDTLTLGLGYQLGGFFSLAMDLQVCSLLAELVCLPLGG
jgi:hypothetical protein